MPDICRVANCSRRDSHVFSENTDKMGRRCEAAQFSNLIYAPRPLQQLREGVIDTSGQDVGMGRIPLGLPKCSSEMKPTQLSSIGEFV